MDFLVTINNVLMESVEMLGTIAATLVLGMVFISIIVLIIVMVIGPTFVCLYSAYTNLDELLIEKTNKTIKEHLKILINKYRKEINKWRKNQKDT